MKTTPNLRTYLILALSALPFSTALAAADPPVEGRLSILWPINGTDLSSGQGDKLRYYIQPTPSGDHLHVYIDDQKPILAKEVKDCPCAIDLPELSPGTHTIALKEATKDQKPTGMQQTVSIKVE